MNQFMDTFVKLSAIFLLALQAGCATEQVGQREGSMSARGQLDQDPMPTATIQQTVPKQSATVVLAPDATRVDDTPVIMPAPSNQPVAAAKDNRQQTSPITIPETKKPQQEANKPQPVTHWSRQLSVTQERFIERNENSLLRIYIDMSKSEVASIMSDYRSGDWVNPCKQEQLMDNNGKIYDVVFYLSRKPVQSRPFNERLMTPIILRNNKVYGIGRYSLKKLRDTSRLVNSISIGCPHA